MRFKVATLSCGFVWLSLIKCCQPKQSEVCDNAKTKLETDLPRSGELGCPEPWPRSSWRLPDISTKYPLQPAEHVCMDMQITYNHTIPSSGAHRPIGARSGEYLYCPPQRWLNNLKDGAIVLLYHPCVSEAARRHLALVANSCLPHYVLTAHPQLSQQRPFALVSWGHTLELSHITTAGVCEWLLTASVLNHTTGTQRTKYSLYMATATSVDGALRATIKPAGQGSKTKSLKSLRACCVEVLSAYEHTAQQTRRSRAANQLRKAQVKPSESPKHNISESQNPNPTQLQPLTTTDDSHTPSASPHGGHASDWHGGRATNATPTGGKEPPQSHGRDEAERVNVTRRPESPTDWKSRRENAGNVRKHRVKTDVKEPSAIGGPATVTPAGERPPPGQSRHNQRNDEAVWAAAALGFLLVLLTLSVLHTRLYRNWRVPGSLYWHEAQQDYESVADIIRRRLRMVGRRKRKVSQGRRQECPLLPDSGTDNESD
ncbi:tumor protein p53-inducible protein 13 isoform X1 [Electrophorus electricus]|uniref:Tumor protein p53-inducible protein 13 n=1 Tax=Electrophorus electricus TaxID=8005 RepID=A0A4W4DP77_ELEEL|nr:tumor protein p53-inducible protein 13 isoform X1 [Electrophorus electricus]XP_026853566.2 tumor protein p53-inducible protein 13 isoform X1 [Electrophorus electricus]